MGSVSYAGNSSGSVGERDEAPRFLISKQQSTLGKIAGSALDRDGWQGPHHPRGPAQQSRRLAPYQKIRGALGDFIQSALWLRGGNFADPFFEHKTKFFRSAVSGHVPKSSGCTIGTQLLQVLDGSPLFCGGRCIIDTQMTRVLGGSPCSVGFGCTM